MYSGTFSKSFFLLLSKISNEPDLINPSNCNLFKFLLSTLFKNSEIELNFPFLSLSCIHRGAKKIYWIMSF